MICVFVFNNLVIIYNDKMWKICRIFVEEVNNNNKSCIVIATNRNGTKIIMLSFLERFTMICQPKKLLS